MPYDFKTFPEPISLTEEEMRISSSTCCDSPKSILRFRPFNQNQVNLIFNSSNSTLYDNENKEESANVYTDLSFITINRLIESKSKLLNVISLPFEPLTPPHNFDTHKNIQINKLTNIELESYISQSINCLKDGQIFDFKKYLRPTNRLRKLLNEDLVSSSDSNKREDNVREDAVSEDVENREKTRVKSSETIDKGDISTESIDGGDMSAENVDDNLSVQDNYIQGLSVHILKMCDNLLASTQPPIKILDHKNLKNVNFNVVSDILSNSDIDEAIEHSTGSSMSRMLCCFHVGRVFSKGKKFRSKGSDCDKKTFSRYDFPILRLIPRSFPLS